jgi:exosome complex RNA-binding protein Rrp4
MKSIYKNEIPNKFEMDEYLSRDSNVEISVLGNGTIFISCQDNFEPSELRILLDDLRELLNRIEGLS